MFFLSAGESSVGHVPIPLAVVDGHLPAPPLPLSGHGPLVIVPPQQSLIPRRLGSYHFSVDDHSVATSPHSASDHISADDASVIPSSRRSSRYSPSVKTYFSAYDV